MINHRETSQAITDLAGIDDGGRTAEAFTRFFHRGSKSGWNGLTQDDFAPLEDAIADAYGRPRRKRKNNLVWKIGFSWHWHITDPIVYPIWEAPFTLADKIAWHAWRKRHGGQVLVPDWRDDGHAYIDFIPWTEAVRQRRELFADLPLAWRLGARLRLVHTGWVWECPDCGIEFARPGLAAEILAAMGLEEHARDAHAGIIPGQCGVTLIFWRGWRRAR